MTPLHQQLLDTLHEVEILSESLAHADALSILLEEEKKEFMLLDESLHKEQADVHALERNGITSLFWKIIGNREEKIDQEREDYAKVSERHIELFKSIELIKFELDILKKKTDLLDIAEDKVTLLFQEREKELVLTDIIIAGLIKNLNEDHLTRNIHLKKVEKINSFGRSILTAVINIENLLDEARALHLSNKVGSTPLSYDKLGYARALVKKTNGELVRFKKELIGIFPDILLDTRINIEYFGSYAKRPIITSTYEPTFLQKIKKSRRNVSDIREQLEVVLTLLDHEQEQVLDLIAGIEEERKKVILSAD